MSGEPSVSAAQVDVLEVLERYRLLTSQQVRRAALPGHSQEIARRHLNALVRAGLVEWTHRRSSHQRVWYLSSLGGESGESKRRPYSSARAGGKLQAHDLDVNEVGLLFAEAARVRGHEADWLREMAHPVGPGQGLKRGGGMVIADALLEYRAEAGAYWRFVEVDRGSESLELELLEKLRGYARLARYAGEGGSQPLWKRFYPRFPQVLVIFSGKPRPQLEARLRAMVNRCAVDAELTELDASGDRLVTLSFGLLAELAAKGPYEPIFARPGEAERVNWLGEASGLRIVATH